MKSQPEVGTIKSSGSEVKAEGHFTLGFFPPRSLIVTERIAHYCSLNRMQVYGRICIVTSILIEIAFLRHVTIAA